jgi:hypothetical protein
MNPSVSFERIARETPRKPVTLPAVSILRPRPPETH